MLRGLTFLNSVIAAVGLLYQTYNGNISPNACVDPFSGINPVVPITNYTFTAPTIVEPNSIAVRQLAFQWFGNSYNQPVVTLNGIAATSSPHCCAPTGCDAAVHYTPWNEGECGLTWCGTSNQWIYLDFMGTSLYSTGVVQGNPLVLQFTNPQTIVDDNGEPIFALSYDLVPIPSVSQTPSITLTSSVSTSSSSSETPSTTLTSSVSSSSSVSPSQTPSMTISSSESSSTTLTPSKTAVPSRTASPSRTQSLTTVSSFFPTPSPTGICYSVSTQFGTIVSLSGGWILVATGINVTQAYGSGYISMGTFAGCSVIGSTCKCSYTGGSTVAGCSGGRKSYITYSYGSTTGITYTNESPTCSYNFAGTIGIPPSTSRTPTLTSSVTKTVSISRSGSVSLTVSVSNYVASSASSTISESASPSISITNSIIPSASATLSETPTRSASATLSKSITISNSHTRSMSSTTSWNESATSTPLYYITMYPSSSATEGPSSTSTPLYQMTPYPSNGSYTATSTPLFMMIPYPSSSPIVNYTYTTLPDSTGTILTAIGVAIVGTSFTIVAVVQFMKPKAPSVPKREQRSVEEEKTHIVISTSDKNEIMKLLQDHQKDFSVL